MKIISFAGSVRRKRAGFSMVEVLVALFVTSVGLLGLAALQMTSLRFSHNSHGRSQATFLAKDMVETMRANKSAARANAMTTEVAAWNATVGLALPSGVGAANVNGDIATVSVTWGEQEGSQTFTYNARL
ncbi:MAG: type IV pilus modification protein PilV [Lysobacteraceae bacterium]